MVTEDGYYHAFEPYEVDRVEEAEVPSVANDVVWPLTTPRAFQHVFEILAKERDIGTPPAEDTISHLIGTADRIGLEVFGVLDRGEISVDWR